MDESQVLVAAHTGLDFQNHKDRKLAKSKRLALSFLLVPCAVFITLTAIDSRHQNIWLDLIAAMSEAAMVGAGLDDGSKGPNIVRRGVAASRPGIARFL